jgi:hypothetical protein
MALAMPDDAAGRLWLTLSQAAAQSGRHIGALRSLVRRERIPARKSNRGQWLVQLRMSYWLILTRPPGLPLATPWLSCWPRWLSYGSGLATQRVSW